MNVTFDWKNWDIEKPEFGRFIIIKGIPNTLAPNSLIFGKYAYVEAWYNTRKHIIIGCELSITSLYKKKTLAYPIYDRNIHDVKWDYYNKSWI